MAIGQNLRYLFSRVPYHLFKRLFKGHRGLPGVLTHSHIISFFVGIHSPPKASEGVFWPRFKSSTEGSGSPAADGPEILGYRKCRQLWLQQHVFVFFLAETCQCPLSCQRTAKEKFMKHFF